ncbi:signal peptidase I [Cellulosilyticum ruminicola]|uniref:signal peptidase I n=1 Tax=Cellulosilyticum ruminicola TaxID=425254 RepID=UPI0006D0C262|nr:signal peptidase I [Cellulosilyticum ruminicola]
MSAEQNRLKAFLEYLKSMVLLALAIILFFTFGMSHNRIPSGSMISTINIGDHIIVNNLPFYYRLPKKGEIIVFHKGKELWVKRLIGYPGDEIDIREGNVYVNGERIDETSYLESEGISTPIMQPGATPIAFPMTVPDDYYFLMGDNRLGSLDCRFEEVGMIPCKDIVGKAWVKIYPFNQIGLLH